jgi:general secretion pathway protein H
LPVLYLRRMPTRRWPDSTAGFTLVELMVVITVFALAAAVVVLVMPDPRGRVHDDAERFAARVRAARSAAIVDARPVSVWVNAAGYGFDERVGSDWRAMSDKPLRVTPWSRGTRAIPASGDGRDRMIFDSTGLADRPMRVRLQRSGTGATVSIGTVGAVRIDG